MDVHYFRYVNVHYSESSNFRCVKVSISTSSEISVNIPDRYETSSLILKYDGLGGPSSSLSDKITQRCRL